MDQNDGDPVSVSKRRVLNVLGMGTLGALTTTAAAEARAAPRTPERRDDAASGPPMAGSLNLNEVPVVDSHMHPVGRTLISRAYEQQAQTFAGLEVPDGQYPGRSELMATTLDSSRRLVWGASRRIGYFNYVARNYHVPATFEGFDSVVSPRIGSDAAFTAYVRDIFDREGISKVVLQAAEDAPSPPATLIPPDRYVWTTVVSEFTRLDWAKSRDLSSIQAVVGKIDETMEDAAMNGCRGFKNVSAYYRPLGLSRPSAAAAEAALQRLLAADSQPTTSAPTPIARSLVPGPKPPQQRYESDPDLRAALLTYEDHLFFHIYLKAGELRRPVIIHSAVALHPSLRLDFNDPRPLYSVFTDPAILKAQTRFVVIHSGYPWQDVMAAFISQLPNVYTDVSFFSKYPGDLSRLYASLLGLGPSYKIMHGSDANSVPEEIGYAAWNSRATLAKLLTEYKQHWGWTQTDIDQAAHNILGANARELFEISG